jgi:hypothetical protein
MRGGGEWGPICRPPANLVRPVGLRPVDPSGPTKGAAGGSRWRRTSKGLYVAASVSDEVVEQRILEQAMRLTRGGAVTGWAALRLAGGNYFDGLTNGGRGRLPVPLAVGPDANLSPGRGAVISREPLTDERVHEVCGIPCVGLRRALFDEMRRAGDVREAVVAMDMAAAARLVAIWQMEEYLSAHRRWRRSRIVERALSLADERSRSPAESRMRLIWVLDAGLPRPLCNRPVFDLGGRHLGTPDLLDVPAGVVGEYDGAIHLSRTQRARDTAREGRFRGGGLEYFTVLGPDMHDVPLVVDRMLASRARALELSPARRWTTDPPDDWEVDLTYGDELRLRAHLHELEHRWR